MKKFKFGPHKDRGQFDWVGKYFKDKEKLTASPYLWTRIKAGIQAEENQYSASRALSGKVESLLRWSLPLILVLSLTFGVYVGKELSSDYLQKSQTQFLENRQETPETDFEPLFEDANEPFLTKLEFDRER